MSHLSVRPRPPILVQPHRALRDIRRARPSAVRCALLLLLAVTIAGCGGASGARPEDVVAGLARALRAGRWDDAYALMSDDYRRRVSREEFGRRLDASRDETRETAALLERPDGPAEQVARVELAEGETVELVRENDAWRIDTSLVDFYDQSSPRSALRSFVRAMERRRWDVVLRFVPDADREGMTPDKIRDAFEGEGREQAARLVAQLRAHLEDAIEEVGDRASLRYGEGDGHTVLFVREDGIWKVEDPDD